MATRTHLTLKEFLALPETEPPCEYLGGEVVQKMSPDAFHAALAGELVGLLRNYLAESGLGRVFTEMRHYSRELDHAYLPDVSVILGSRVEQAFRENSVGWPPDLAIEILSPDDRAGDVLQKVELYQQLRFPLLWVVDFQQRAIHAHRLGDIPTMHVAPARISAAPVLPGFRLALDELFAILPGSSQG